MGEVASSETSGVWQYFHLENENKVVCSLSQNKLACNYLIVITFNHDRNHVQHMHKCGRCHDTDVCCSVSSLAGEETKHVKPI